MVRELLLAAFIMAIGLSIAATGTYCYQWIAKEAAQIRYAGKTLIRTFGHLAVSFLCGPFIILQMGWKQESDGTLSLSSALLSAFVAFGWSFITGLLTLGAFVGLMNG